MSAAAAGASGAERSVEDFHLTRYAAYISQSGLGLPDRAYYLDAKPAMAKLRAQYRAHIAATFKLAGIEHRDDAFGVTDVGGPDLVELVAGCPFVVGVVLVPCVTV